jgi:hypothetical protein
MSETVIIRCRLCNKPMNVPKSIMMVFTFDPSVCDQCREKAPKGLWDTVDEDSEEGKPETKQRLGAGLW